MALHPIGVVDEQVWDLTIGFARELSTALARFRLMAVVPGDQLTLPARTRDGATIGGTFEVDYLVDGSIQNLGDRISITIRVLDLRSANQVVWARRFDRRSNNLHALQNEIAAQAAAQVKPEILFIEARRRGSDRHSKDTVYDLVCSATTAIAAMEYGSFIRAGANLARAITLDPQYATAYAWYAYWHTFLVGQGWVDHPQPAIAEAGELAEWAVLLDPFDAKCLTFAGHVWACLQRRPRDSIGLHTRALALNPNLAAAWALSAIAYAYIGDTNEAEQRISRYKRLSPIDPYAFIFDGFMTTIQLLKRDHESAALSGRMVTQMNPLLADSFKPYLAALGHLGRSHEAGSVLRRLRVTEPDFNIRRFLATTPLEQTSDRDHFAEGLRLAGVPEGAV